MAKKPKIHFDVPCVIHDVMSYAKFHQLAVEIAGKGYDSVVNTVCWFPTTDYVHAVGLMPTTISVPDGKSIRTRWAVTPRDPEREALAFKAQALRHGATPEAVRLLRAMVPISKSEETTMAEKLKAKGATKSSAKAPTKGNAKALKEAAADAPVKKTAPAKPAMNEKPANRKGNPEALAKARAARADAGPDKRKITVLKKPHGARDGTARAALLDKIYRSKTVDGADENGVKKADVSWAAKAGYISLA